MSENRCPMCSKVNPADAEECQFCGARIKPLFIEPSDGEGFGASSGLSWAAKDDSWTERMRMSVPEDQGGQEDPLDTPAGDDESEESWMDRLRSGSVLDEEPLAEHAIETARLEKAEESDSQWLDSLRSRIPTDDQGEGDPDTGEESAEDLGEEWLSRMRSGLVIPDEESGPEPSLSQDSGTLSTPEDPSTGAAAEADDEFFGLRRTGFEESPDGAPDWLDSLGMDEPAEDAEDNLEPSGSDSASDWLNRLGGLEASASGLEEDLAQKDPQEVPDWLSGLREVGKTGAERLDAQAAPDWLSGLGEEEGADAESLEPLDAKAAPGWLRGLGEEEGADAESLEPLDAQAAPDWLSGLGEEEGADAESLEPLDAQAAPGWLSGLGEEEGADAESLEPLDAQAAPGWLSGLHEVGQPDAESLEPLDAQAAPGWLSGLGEEDESGAAAVQSEEDDLAPLDVGSAPGWLRGFIDEQDRLEKETDLPGDEDSQGDATGKPDWLRSALGGIPVSDESEDDAAMSAEGSGPSQYMETPDWLRDAFDSSEDESELEDELSRLQMEAEEDPEAGGLPDWFSGSGKAPQRIRPESPSVEPGEDAEEPLPEDSAVISGDRATPKWLQDIIKETKVDVDSELESVLGRKLRNEEDPVEVNQEDQLIDEKRGEDASPDYAGVDSWMDAAGENESEEDDIFGSALAGAELPEWLKGAREHQDAAAEEAVSSESDLIMADAEEAPGETALPESEAVPVEDLVPGFELREYSQAAGVPEEVGEEDQEELTWLDAIHEHADEPLDEDESLDSAEMPDWLSQIRNRQSKQTTILSLGEDDQIGIPTEDGEGAGESAAFPSQDSDPYRIEGAKPDRPDTRAPSWLDDLDTGMPREPEDDFPEDNENAFPGGEEPSGSVQPSWLVDLPDAPISPPSAPAFVNGSLPMEGASDFEDFDFSGERESVWLEEIQSDGEQVEDAGRDRIDLTRATLPAWLEAMRPMDNLAGSQDGVQDRDEYETAGPLAGIAGALAAEPAVAAQRKIHSGASILTVTDEEYSRADLLSRLVGDEESELKPVPRESSVQKRLRWVISAVLLLVVFIPSFLGFPTFSLPVKEPSDLDALFRIIDSLPVDEPALIVYDIEPGFAAEMEAAASPVLYHLLGRRVPVVTLSTDITGPALADRMLRRISLPYLPVNGEDYLHLGYLSGGSTGIQLFVSHPAYAALEGYLRPEGSGEEGWPWSSPLLSGVTSLSDFSMVAVIADDADRARAWIEQAGPVLNGRPLIMVVSTGLEPVVRPYYEGSDPAVSSVLTGMSAAAAYDLRFQRSGGAAALWNPYNSLATVMFLILTITAGISLFRLIKEYRQKAENA